MSLSRTAPRAAAIVAIAFAGACSDVTAPTIDYIDAQAATAKAAPVMEVMEQPELAGFASLTSMGGLPASASAAALGSVARITNSAVRGRWDASAPLMARDAARAADVLPIDVRGNTYTYNAETQSYEVNAARDGEVSNGIRIVLYAWDFLAGQPSLPLTPIGHVDMIDESNSTQNRLHVTLVRDQDNAQLMDYSITHSVNASSETFSIAGSARKGIIVLNFELLGTASETSATVKFDLSAPVVPFSVYVEANVNALNESGTIHVALGYDEHRLTFDLTASQNAMNAEIKFDGKRYATYAATYDPTTGEATAQFSKASGQPLTAQELEQLENLFERALDFDRFWEALLWPVATLATPV